MANVSGHCFLVSLLGCYLFQATAHRGDVSSAACSPDFVYTSGQIRQCMVGTSLLQRSRLTAKDIDPQSELDRYDVENQDFGRNRSSEVGKEIFNHAAIEEMDLVHTSFNMLFAMRRALSQDALLAVCAFAGAAFLSLFVSPSVGSILGDEGGHLSLGLHAIAASLPCFIDGINFSIASGVLYQLDADKNWLLVVRALVVGGLQIGQMFSSFVFPPLVDACGTKLALQLISVGQFLALISMAVWSESTMVLIIGRIASGIFFGQVVSPLYLAEMAPLSARGFAVSFAEVLTNLGSLAGFVLHIVFQGTQVWRIWMSCAVAALGSNLVVACLPAAQRSSADESNVDDASEAKSRRHDAANGVETKDSLRELFGRRSLAIACALGFLQQSTGEEVLYGFATQLAKDSGLASPLRFGLILGLVTLTGNMFSNLFIDRVGRRALLIGGMLAMGTCWTLAFLALAFDAGPLSVLSSILLYELSFAFSLGPVFFIVASEMLPIQLRARGFAVALFVSRLTACAMVLTFEFKNWLFKLEGTFVVYAALMFGGAHYVYTRLPETKGRSTSDIQRALGE